MIVPAESSMLSLSDALRHFWHPIAWADELRDRPIHTRLLDTPLVCWRVDGEALVAIDRCPHRGTQLSLGEVEGGQLVCPYHGWRFGPAGACEEIPQLVAGSSIPANAILTMVQARESYGILWAALEDPIAPIAEFPEWDDPSYVHVACRPYTWQAGAGRMLENFTDFGHLGYLHDGLLGMRDDLVVPEHAVTTDGLALEYEISMAVPNTNDRYAVTDVAADRGLQTNTYVLTLPFSIHLRCRYEDSGSYRTLYFAVQPLSESESTGYCYQTRDFDLDAAPEAFAEFQELLAEQDRPIVESQWPKEVPLGAGDEVHLGFDRVAIAYRRALRRLVAGVAETR
jgi:phenylpropionate dioxygenase-like ring-hydroxylating dioxygenase large terminal subunit